MAGPKSGTLVPISVLKVTHCAGTFLRSEIHRYGTRPGVSSAFRGTGIGHSDEYFTAQRFARVQVLRYEP